MTEVGVIPEDWGCVELGRLTSKVGSGKTPTGGSVRYKSEGRPFVRSQNVGWGALVLYDLIFIDEATHAEFPATEVELGDVLLNITGASIGRSALADQRVAAGNVNQHVCIIRPKANELNSRFLCSFLLSAAGQSQIDSFQAGGNREGLNFKQVRAFAVPVPRTVTEQAAIAEALSDVDEAIAAQEAVIAKKRALKTAVVKNLLSGRIRLPGFIKPWGEQRLGKLAESTAGGTPSTKKTAFWGGHIPWMSSGELHQKRIHSVSGRITRLGLENSPAKWVPANSVLIGLAGQGKTRGTAAISKIALTTNQSIAAIIPNDTIDPEYLFYNLDNRYEELRFLSSGDGTRGGLNLKILNDMMVPLPCLDEQSAIASVLADIDADLEALKLEFDKLRHLKTGMMQQLLTGKIRLV